MNLKTGLLIGTSPKNIGNLFKSSIPLDSLSTLYIKLISNVILESLLLNSKQTFNISKECFRNTVFDYYSQVKNVDNVDVRVLLSNFKDGDLHKVTTSKPIDVIYFDSSYSSKAVAAFANKYVENKSKNFQISSFPVLDTECNFNLSKIVDNQTTFKEYDYVVLGGTFDKLHLGHKSLLSEAVLRCRKRLTVGVCSDLILNSKILPELIEDCNTRIRGLENFLHDVEPNINYNIVPINDVYGPTKEDASLQMIVVSMETIRGAEKINEYRKANGLGVLDVININLIDAFKKSDHEESKISSSNRRMRMLGELLKPPPPRPNLPSKPYIIGLTGGIASGKSSVSDYLKTLGCGYVNCDEIGHKIYDIGFPGHNFIVENFGPSVLNEDGSVNRKKLGSIVFNDKEKLNHLNAGLWPLILQQLRQEIRGSQQNKDIIVVEAALLIKANWTNECHEIWSCIIPPDEATKRLQVRNNLSIEDAHKRISSLPSNKEYVAHSNIVFCTLWDKSYTKQQVEKAWYNLKKRVAILD